MLRRAITSVARRSYAKVSNPAPAFSGQAVVNGAFEEISLEKYNSEVSQNSLEFLNLILLG